MIWGLLNLSEHPFLISKVWLIRPRVRICQGGLLLLHHLLLWSLPMFTTAPGEALQLLADGRNNSAALLKWSCKGRWLHVGLSRHSLWSLFWIRHVVSSALEMLRSWRTHTWQQSPSEPRSRTSKPRSTSNTHQQINLTLISWVTGLHSLPSPDL